VPPERLEETEVPQDPDPRYLGEHLSVSERLVISPVTGVYQPPAVDPSGGRVHVGMLLGTVAAQGVRSPFAGSLMGMLAHPEERVHAGQPIAWLRADEAA
jgi:biotin carboxyl carrier protein